MARSATRVLPAPTSPWSRRFMRSGAGHVGGDLRDRPRLGAGRGVGEGGEHLGLEPAVAAGGDAAAALHPAAGDGEGKLVGEELVVGEPLARLRRGRQVGRALGRVGGGEGGAPVGPALPALEARLDPLGQVGRERDGRGGGLDHGLERQGPGSAGRPARRRAAPRPPRGAGCGRGGPSGRCRRRSRPCPRRSAGCPRAGDGCSQSGCGWKKTSWNSVRASRTRTR